MRIVTSSATQPFLIQEGKFPIAVCVCGLSKNKPHCDGSHKKTADESPGELYIYDGDRRVSLKTVR